MMPLHYVRCHLLFCFFVVLMLRWLLFLTTVVVLLSVVLLVVVVVVFGAALQLSDCKVRCDVLLLCWPRTAGKHCTHRGARTHDHKVKGLALCRLS